MNLITRLIQRLFMPTAQPPAKEAGNQDPERVYDPLDPMRPLDEGFGGQNFVLKSVSDFPMYEEQPDFAAEGRAMDAAPIVVKGKVLDDAISDTPAQFLDTGPGVPPALQSWYMRQSFIGYQACAMIAQHWLVEKACAIHGQDAVRHGWEIKAHDENALDETALNSIREFDKNFNVKVQCAEFVRNINVFGIRVVLFDVDSEDPDYYEKPFNPDGVTEGSYKGIRQIDPYWMTPMLSMKSTSDPTSEHFYDPEYWVISGRKYHRSHLIIGRGPQPADFLKPQYIFGGIPLTQRIYERVYAAERTANEAPLLAMDKRTTSLHVDLKKVAANQHAFEQRLAQWVGYKDNHAVKVLGLDETMEQFDTSLSDFDSVIMNQFQLVSSIANAPATKLLGTSPKGFDATGEFETISYHEELESIQENKLTPLVNRHLLLATRSLGLDIEVEVVWNPVDSFSAEKMADINKTKAETGQILINSGSISPDHELQRVRNDRHSGYNLLDHEEAETDFGMSPENIAELEKGESAEEKGEAALGGTVQPNSTNQPQPAANVQEPRADATKDDENPTAKLLVGLASRLASLEDLLRPDGSTHELDSVGQPGSVAPSIKPSVGERSVVGSNNIVGPMKAHKLPKMKLHGLTLAIENPKGTIRTGKDVSGNSWQSVMPAHYGYIKGTTGADGDEMDCFVGPNMTASHVFVVNQNDPNSGEFDEHKCMMGFDTAEQAKAYYDRAFDVDWKGFDSIHAIPVDKFKDWLKSGDLTTPYKETK